MIEPHEPYEIPKENPCNGCQKRTETCHINCFDYLLFQSLKELEQEENRKEAEALKMTYAITKDRAIKAKRKIRGKKFSKIY